LEYWDIYDIERIKTGETMVRGSEYKDGARHLVVHICIFNSKGEMLIQHRQPFKSGWSNLWDITVGGSAVSGDNSRTAMERELREELGIELDMQSTHPHLTINNDHVFDDYYLVEKDIDIKNLKLQYEEVQDAKWATKEEIINMIENGDFIPYYPNFINLLFDMRKHFGCRFKGDTTTPTKGGTK
jgi:isopentenyldiphosphate isomerase